MPLPSETLSPAILGSLRRSLTDSVRNCAQDDDVQCAARVRDVVMSRPDWFVDCPGAGEIWESIVERADRPAVAVAACHALHRMGQRELLANVAKRAAATFPDMGILWGYGINALAGMGHHAHADRAAASALEATRKDDRMRDVLWEMRFDAAQRAGSMDARELAGVLAAWRAELGVSVQWVKRWAKLRWAALVG